MSLFQQTFPTVSQIGLLANGSALPPVPASVAAGTTSAATGVTNVVPAASVPAGEQVALLGVILSSNGAVVGNFQSSTTTAVASGNFYLTAGAPLVVPASALPCFVTAVGEGLDWSQVGSYAVGVTCVWSVYQSQTL